MRILLWCLSLLMTVSNTLVTQAGQHSTANWGMVLRCTCVRKPLVTSWSVSLSHLMMTTLPLNCSVSLDRASIMSSSQSKHSA